MHTDELKQAIIDYSTNQWATFTQRDIIELGAMAPAASEAILELLRDGVIEEVSYGAGRERLYRRLPRVGDRATLYSGSDRYAYNIVSVSASGQSFAIDCPSGCAFNTAATSTVRRANDGRWYTKGGKARGSQVSPGLDRDYRDPSF